MTDDIGLLGADDLGDPRLAEPLPFAAQASASETLASVSPSPGGLATTRGSPSASSARQSTRLRLFASDFRYVTSLAVRREPDRRRDHRPRSGQLGDGRRIDPFAARVRRHGQEL